MPPGGPSRYGAACSCLASLRSVSVQNCLLKSACKSRVPLLQLAINEFADLTWDEFRATHLGLLPMYNLTNRCIPRTGLDPL